MYHIMLKHIIFFFGILMTIYLNISKYPTYWLNIRCSKCWKPATHLVGHAIAEPRIDLVQVSADGTRWFDTSNWRFNHEPWSSIMKKWKVYGSFYHRTLWISIVIASGELANFAMMISPCAVDRFIPSGSLLHSHGKSTHFFKNGKPSISIRAMA